MRTAKPISNVEVIRQHLEVCRKQGRTPGINELRAACYWCGIEEVRRCLEVIAAGINR